MLSDCRYGAIISTKAILDKDTNKCKGESLTIGLHLSLPHGLLCALLIWISTIQVVSTKLFGFGHSLSAFFQCVPRVIYTSTLINFISGTMPAKSPEET